jgi:hypothetical protein
MTEVLLRESKNGKKDVIVFPVHEYWLDIGRVDEFERGQEEVEREDRIRSTKRRRFIYDFLIYGGLLVVLFSMGSDFFGLGAGRIDGIHVYGPIQKTGNIVGLILVLGGLFMKKLLR